MSIVIVDLGAGGNLRSVCKAVEHVGARARISSAAAEVASASHLILPGQGALGSWMTRLNQNADLHAAVTTRLSQVPALGICLGLHALYQCSEEDGGTRGLGLLNGTVRKFSADDAAGDTADDDSTFAVTDDTADDDSTFAVTGDTVDDDSTFTAAGDTVDDDSTFTAAGDTDETHAGKNSTATATATDTGETHADKNSAATDTGETCDGKNSTVTAAAETTAAKLKIPHMGWNHVRQTCAHALWRGIDDGARFYFVHSYFAQGDAAEVAGVCEYGRAFTAAAARGNLFATQFHPEKSAHAGLQLLRNFINWDGRAN